MINEQFKAKQQTKARRRKIAISLALIALVVASLACKLPGKSARPPADLPTIPVSIQEVQKLEENIQAAVETATATGKISIEITEAQVTSLVAVELQKQQPAIFQDPQIYLRDGQVQIYGNVNQSGVILPLKVVLTISLDEQGNPQAKIVSAHLGPLPLPKNLLDTISTRANQALSDNLGSQTGNMVIESITIADGKITITGHTR